MKSLLVVLGVALAMSTFANAQSEKITKVKTDQPYVALTFDDGPNGENMAAMMKILADNEAKATFFLIGKNVVKEPELAAKVHEQGHEIGNHTMTHPHLTKLPAEEVDGQIAETQKVIAEATGVTPIIFRAPYLDQNNEVLTVVEQYGMPYAIGSSISVRDWQKDVTTEKIYERAAKGQAGDVILMHSWSVHTREALPRIIETLRSKGLQFVTVSELLAARTDQ
ncbi:polysaccharide deacetylase family protein [Cerasicoccus maritimus]|uniref:polysaccharide deacetylase family protein n=1 Tax=Cerasicoccus maritimus TaxID=490089 RepID=UPI0028529B3E|nr:polysaccharide deacetylase family protein [Cerasicoccus maritimus]